MPAKSNPRARKNAENVVMKSSTGSKKAVPMKQSAARKVTSSTKRTAAESTSSTPSKKPFQHRLLNSKTSRSQAREFYHDLAPTTVKQLKNALSVAHGEKPYISMQKLYVGPSSLEAVAGVGGRGVFAGERFKKGEVVEICPLLLDTDSNWKFTGSTMKTAAHEHYTISWQPDWIAFEEIETRKRGTTKKQVITTQQPSLTRKMDFVREEWIGKRPKSGTGPFPSLEPMSAIMLGYGSLYNHARKHANVEWKFGADATVMFIASRDLKRGEELFVDYGDQYWTGAGGLGFVPDA